MADYQKLVSSFRYATGIAANRWRRAAAGGFQTIVICYHRVVSEKSSEPLFNVERGISAALFERQIRFLLKNFQPVAASQILHPHHSSATRFAVTFDDGYADNYSVAAPILKRLGVTATFFVVSDFVGTDRRFWWECLASIMRRTSENWLDPSAISGLRASESSNDKPLPIASVDEKRIAFDFVMARALQMPHSDLPRLLDRIAHALRAPVQEEGRDFPLMGWEDLRSLARDGFNIGAHTATHCNLGLPETLDLEREIVQSTQEIGHQLDREIRDFAFPYGRHHHQHESARSLLTKCGIHRAFTTETGVVGPRTRPFEIPRFQLNRNVEFAWSYNIDRAYDRALQS